MPRLLQINEYTKKEIINVKKFAVEHILDDEYRIEILAGTKDPPGDNPDHVVRFHDGFRAVYSVDKINGELYHHLSLSYKTGWIGIPEATVILREFGMADDIHDLDNVWMEEEMKAVNFLKKFEDE